MRVYSIILVHFVTLSSFFIPFVEHADIDPILVISSITDIRESSENFSFNDLGTFLSTCIYPDGNLSRIWLSSVSITCFLCVFIRNSVLFHKTFHFRVNIKMRRFGRFGTICTILRT